MTPMYIFAKTTAIISISPFKQTVAFVFIVEQHYCRKTFPGETVCLKILLYPFSVY